VRVFPAGWQLCQVALSRPSVWMSAWAVNVSASLLQNSFAMAAIEPSPAQLALGYPQQYGDIIGRRSQKRADAHARQRLRRRHVSGRATRSHLRPQ
jgi:hypothetical protein